MTRRALVLLASLAALAACVSVNKTVLMDRSAYPVPQAQVYVFLPQDSIEAECQRVALMNASGDESMTNESQMMNKLREEAGKLGANAIQMLSMEDPGGAERFASAIFGTTADRDGAAIALWCPSRPGGSVEPDTSGVARRE